MNIKIENISKSFGSKKVLNEISLFLEKEKTTVLLGPSGCGKSTLLRIIAGLEEADCGSISQMKENFGFVFQEERLLDLGTVEENLKFVAGNEIVKSDLYSSVLSLLKIKELEKRQVGNLSGGERQRVAIARAFLYNSDTILMDEPFKSLDPVLKSGILKDILRLLKNQPRTILLVTHDIKAAVTLGNTIHLLSRNPSTIVKSVVVPQKADCEEISFESILRMETELFRDMEQIQELETPFSS